MTDETLRQRRTPNLMIVVLAAGKGTRMRSELPKVLHRAADQALIDHVLDLAERLTSPENIVVVVGHQAKRVEGHVRDRGVPTALQEPQLGTGDALRVAVEAHPGPADQTVVVLSGDVPLLREHSVRALLTELDGGNAAAVLTAVLDDPGAYGRIVRGPGQRVRAIVEARDADSETLAVREVNAGVYAFRRGPLDEALASLRPDNSQGEYYLTDVVAYLVDHGLGVAAVVLDDPGEMRGVNTVDDLAAVERAIGAALTSR